MRRRPSYPPAGLPIKPANGERRGDGAGQLPPPSAGRSRGRGDGAGQISSFLICRRMMPGDRDVVGRLLPGVMGMEAGPRRAGNARLMGAQGGRNASWPFSLSPCRPRHPASGPLAQGTGEQSDQLGDLGFPVGLISRRQTRPDAAADMVLQHHQLDLCQGGLYRLKLGEDVDAVAVIRHHLLQTAHLPLDPAQSVELVLRSELTARHRSDLLDFSQRA